jgi:DNA uptake protein ComE-like DNA-binding protein
MRIPLALLVFAALAGGPAAAQTVAPSITRQPAAASPAKPAAPSASTSKEALIDINSATKEELDALPQIGSARAEAIIKGRPYKSKDDLRKNKVIPENAYNAIKEKIVARQKS